MRATKSHEKATRKARKKHEKGPKPKFLSPDIVRWGRGLPHKGVEDKKLGMSLETSEIKRFWILPGYPGILPGYPGGARKV